MDPTQALEAVLALINTRPLGRRPEGLHRWANLDPQLTQLLPGTAAENRPPSTAVTHMRQVRDALITIVLSDSPGQATEQLNDLAASCGRIHPPSSGHPQRQPATGTAPPAAELMVALIPLLHQAVAEGALERIGVCPDLICQNLFLDRTRTRTRRYCSSRCSTRARMNRHRRQHRPNKHPTPPPEAPTKR